VVEEDVEEDCVVWLPVLDKEDDDDEEGIRIP
jgi:hypothetical protein